MIRQVFSCLRSRAPVFPFVVRISPSSSFNRKARIMSTRQPLQAQATASSTSAATAQVNDADNNTASTNSSSVAISNNSNEVGTTSTTIVDNPCWGSPQHCSLSYLLSLPSCQRQRAIIYESPNYIALNKPPDLRMDREYPATVHKLVTYWYPSPTLQEIAKSNSTVEGQGDNNADNELNAPLLEAVSKLHKHNDLKDNELRPCHQLDYATSGVLLLARTSQAANKARIIFQERSAVKTYVAVVEGHLQDISLASNQDNENSEENKKGLCHWPILAQSQVDTSLQSAEGAYRGIKGRPEKKKKAGTFNGCQPAHSLYNKWIVHRMQQVNPKLESERSKNRKRKRQSLLSEEDWAVIWSCVDNAPQSATLELDLNWKELCQKYPEIQQAFLQASTRHNDILRQKIAEQQQADDATNDTSITLPTVFRVADETAIDNMNIYIYAPLAQMLDDFAMKIPPSIVGIHTAIDGSSLKSLCGSPDLDYKPSLTKCTILSRAYYKGRPVTKVKLYPKTGRRHQLRVHLALLGHPILGDATYSSSRPWAEESKLENPDSRATPSQENGGETTDRMCLHAFSLEMPLDEQLDTPTQSGKSKQNWKVTAPDPFIISPHGELSISL